jgi:nicotinate-nucleotide adenylyltransferase
MLGPRRPVVRIHRPLADDAPVKRAPRLRIGLLGGSFNPAHQGHVSVSLQAVKRLRLDRVWWLVSPQNPLKAAGGMAGFEERLASADAISDHPRIEVSDLEQRLGMRYSIDTLRWLRSRRRADFVWLIGADILAQLPQWRSWQQLVRLVPIAVVDREPYSYSGLAGKAARRLVGHRWPEGEAAGLAGTGPPAWVFLRVRRHEASSTAIRRRRRTGRRPCRKEEAS